MTDLHTHRSEYPPRLLAHLLRRVGRGGRLKRIWRRLHRKGAKS